jgi:hypothetical protein
MVACPVSNAMRSGVPGAGNGGSDWMAARSAAAPSKSSDAFSFSSIKSLTLLTQSFVPGSDVGVLSVVSCSLLVER